VPAVQGELRLTTSDPLSFDDIRSFTVNVRPPNRVLVSADSESEALYLLEALSAFGNLRYQVDFVETPSLRRNDLKRYTVVCLMNAADPEDAEWTALADYVRAGGSAFIALGDKVSHPKYLAASAKEVLPGELRKDDRFAPAEFLDLQNVLHPLLKPF